MISLYTQGKCEQPVAEHVQDWSCLWTWRCYQALLPLTMHNKTDGAGWDSWDLNQEPNIDCIIERTLQWMYFLWQLRNHWQELVQFCRLQCVCPSRGRNKIIKLTVTYLNTFKSNSQPSINVTVVEIIPTCYKGSLNVWFPCTYTIRPKVYGHLTITPI